MSESPGSPSESAPKIPRATDIEASHVVCPHCGTANRLQNSQCVQCDRDITMLRVLANKARHHFNSALEHAERQRWEAAIGDLRHALEIDENFVAAWNVLGTCLAKLERFDEAQEAWQRSINVDPRFAKAHEYLGKVEEVGLARESRRQAEGLRRQLKTTRVLWGLTVLTLLVAVGVPLLTMPRGEASIIDPSDELLQRATAAYAENNWDASLESLRALARRNPPPATATAASSLSTVINRELGRMEAEMEEAAEHGDWRHGLVAGSRLLGVNPPPDLRERAVGNCWLFGGRLIGELRAGLTALAEGEITTAQMRTQIAGVAPLMPTDALRAEVNALVASVEQIATAQRREAFHEVWEETLQQRRRVSDVEWLLRMREMSLQWGDQHEVPAALAAEEENLTLQIRESWEASAGSWRAAQSFAEQMRTIQERVDLPVVDVAIASAEAAMPCLRYEHERDAANTLAGTVSAEEQIAVWERLDLTCATVAERASIEGRLAELREQAALERALRARRVFEELLAQDLAFETLTMDEESARRAVENADLIIEATPDRFYSRGFRTDYALYYAARGAENLGNPAMAISLYERHQAEASGGDHGGNVEAHLARLRAGQ